MKGFDTEFSNLEHYIRVITDPAEAIRHLPATGKAAPPLGVLWVTPMRALAADSHRALAAAQMRALMRDAWALK